MPKKTPNLEIIEHSGIQYPSLEAAQAASLSTIAPLLADTMRRLIESGELVIINGVVTIPPNA